MGKGFGGGFPGNMQDMMKQAQKMQQQLVQLQEEAKTEEADGTAGGGMVKVVALGSQQVKSIEIEKEVVNPDDVEMLQDLIVAATNEALNNVQKKVQEKMSKITGGMNIPGLGGM
ncbi:MAG: YbaB/EbfC family nucleoid-associated protein [Bdellovibrionales bacterium]|nr:YbaB/EbfC family nucleoid-associated protein [Bdellovibrionales bacterium]